MANELEERLRRLRESGSPRPDATDRARHAAMQSLSAKRPRRWGRWLHVSPRRTLSTALAVAVTVALAAVLVLAMPRGEEPIAITTITLTATPPEPGDPVDSASLQTASEMIDRRAEIMGIEGVDANVVDGRIAIGFSGAPAPGVLADLTAPGKFAVYSSALVVGQQRDGTKHPSPGERLRGSKGRIVIEEQIASAESGTVAFNHLVIRDEAALTNEDVSSVTVEDVPGERNERFIEARLTDEGTRAWHALTRDLSQQGALLFDLKGALMVLDGYLISQPVIDPSRFPDGIASGMMQIQVAADTPETVAAQIQEGPLPMTLTVVP